MNQKICRENILMNDVGIINYNKLIVEMVEQIENVNHLISIYSFVKVKYEKSHKAKKEIG